MVRRRFLNTTRGVIICIPLIALNISSCGSIHYVSTYGESDKLSIAKSEFLKMKTDHETRRQFIFVKSDHYNTPICLYRQDEKKYYAALMKCTHRGCELNITGQSYTCPCHGSEYTIKGDVIRGPAIRDLTTFRTATDKDNIYILLK